MRGRTVRNNGEVQAYYIEENHPAIISIEDWEKVQELMEKRKKKRKIGAGGVEKYKNRYPLSGMLICPHCGKILRRKQVYNKRIEWWCSTYISKGKSTCKGIKIADEIASKKNITEQTVIEEVMIDGEKHYSYTSKTDYDRGIRNEPDAPQLQRMAAYCRVSTDNEEQLLSYENQVRYYTEYINNSPLYTMAGIYADEGISATNTKKRENFNRMIKDCREGKIDMIITKSISRFARNTLDCLNFVRELKELGVGVIFEKEAINTLDAKGEVLLTILSSLAQDESRSISENSTWGIRRRFENGQFKMSTKRFLGYDTDENGKLVINREQAKIVEKIYDEYLSGKTVDHIKRILEREEVKNWNGTTKWHAKTIQSMLQNEKYKGDAILQKSYTVDFLTKKRAKNEGHIQQYHIEENHEAIIDPLIWEAVQLEYDRRSNYIEEHGTNSYSHNPERNFFAGKVVCGTCNQAFTRKGWKSKNSYRKVWQCQERYKVKGVQGCTNRHIDEVILIDAFILSWNALLDNREELKKKWETTAEFGNPLEQYRAVQFADITEDAKHIKEIDTDFILKTLDYIKVYETGKIIIRFMDGTEMECNGE